MHWAGTQVTGVPYAVLTDPMSSGRTSRRLAKPCDRPNRQVCMPRVLTHVHAPLRPDGRAHWRQLQPQLRAWAGTTLRAYGRKLRRTSTMSVRGSRRRCRSFGFRCSLRVARLAFECLAKE